MGEYFDKIKEDTISRSEDKLKIKRILQKDGLDNSSIGKIIIDSTSYNIYKWKFKIGDNITWHDEIMIGITTSTNVNDGWIYERKPIRYYGYRKQKGDKYYLDDDGSSYGLDYGVEFKGGDIVDMILDLNEKQLYFLVNDEHQGVAFGNGLHARYSIKCGDEFKYRMVVSLEGVTEDWCVELIDFEIDPQFTLSNPNKRGDSNSSGCCIIV